MFFHHCFLKMAKNGGRYVKSIYPPKNIPKTSMMPDSGPPKGHLAQKHQIMVKKKERCPNSQASFLHQGELLPSFAKRKQNIWEQ